MKIPLVVTAAFLVISGSVRGDCLPSIEGSVQATFRVDSCRLVKAATPDRRPLVRLSVSDLDVRTSPGPGDSEESISIYGQYAANIGRRKHLFVDATGGATCLDFPPASEHSAGVEVLCCDTIPHQDDCALAGPLIRPN